MKTYSSLLAGLAAFAMGIGLVPAAAQGRAASLPAAAASPTVTGPSHIATINFELAIATSQEGKKAADDVTARFAPKQKELQASQAEIQALQKQLADGGNTMSADAKADLNAQIQSKQRDLQQSAQNDQSDYQDAQTEILNTVGVKMSDVIKQYAQQHGYTVVIDVSQKWPQGPVLYFNPGTDITGDVVKLYDQTHPLAAKP